MKGYVNVTDAVRVLVVCALCFLCAGPAAAADPLGSVRWEVLEKEFFKNARVVFDERVRVVAPAVAEDPLNVPVAVSVEGLDRVEEVQVFAEFNPIIKILQFYPQQAKPFLAFRVKLQQSSPIRAAARTADGVWHVGGAWVKTTGGGCTVPSMGAGSPLWQSRLGEVQGRVFPASGSGQRVRARIVHPMDTGLVKGIPAFYIQELQFKDAQGSALMRIEPFEPVSENPVFTLEFAAATARGQALLLTGVDNNGNRIAAEIRQ